MRLVLGLSVIMTLAAAVPDAAAQRSTQELRIRPALVVDEPMLGMRLTAAVTRAQLHIGAYPRDWFIAASADAPLFTTAERNPETLRGRLHGGLQLSLFRPSTPVGQAPSPDDPEPWNYGYVAVQLGAGVEAPQALGTADITVGGALAYEHDQYHRLWFVPELRIAYDAVFCVDCAAPDGAGAIAEDDTGWRVDGEIGWSVPADHAWVPGALKPFWLRLRGRAFRTSGLHVEPVRNDEGLSGSAELAYRCDRCGPVHEVYVRGHDGRLPQQLREKRAVTAGVSLFF
jgi:hypothetical protein